MHQSMLGIKENEKNMPKTGRANVIILELANEMVS